MNAKELKEKISEQQFKLKKAKTSGMMVAQETDRLRNILVNSLDDILEALDMAISAEDRIECLTVEIESADAELQEKDDEIKALKEAVANKPAAKSKSKAKTENVE